MPDGTLFSLSTQRPRTYLHHASHRGEWFLSSDSIVHTYAAWHRTRSVVHQIPPDEIREFVNLACTVGGYIVFPVDADRRPTLNQARGVRAVISDRFDLTLECIRRHYLGATSPLTDVLSAYADFFALFESFENFAEFFLLQDLVEPRSDRIRFLLPFEDFAGRPLPQTVAEYRHYRDRCTEFVCARNARIDALTAVDGVS